MRIRREKVEKDAKSKKIAFWVIVVVSAIVLIFLLKKFVISAYRVPTNDMSGVLMRGDFVLVVKLPRSFKPKIGDVVIFKYPAETSQYRFGRVLADGGNVIQIFEKRLFVDDIPQTNPPSVHFSDSKIDRDVSSSRDFFGPFRVPEKSYFILGDNRDEAIDSRTWGALPHDNIFGKPLIVYFSWRPDPRAPKIEGLFSFLNSFFYNLTHLLNRVGFERFGKVVR